MKFFKQRISNTCNIIAIEDVLSFFNQYESQNKIKSDLPKHTFGSLITEIGIFFEQKGFKTKLISNEEKFIITDKSFLKSLKKYKKYGIFEDRLIQKSDINKNPIIVNVNRLDILDKKGIPVPHYIVLLKEKNKLWVYDGKDFQRKVERDFNSLLNASDDINKFHQNGMWLIFQ